MMFKLRILLLLVLLGQAVWLVWHVPWRVDMTAEDRRGSQSLGTAPWFRPPSAPEHKEITTGIFQYLEPHEVQTEVVVDGPALFRQFAWRVVITFFVYGVIGYFLTERPRPADVSYSLALTTGYGAGSVASALAAYFVQDDDPLPWLNVFWALGVGIALLITIYSRSEQRVLSRAPR